MQIDIISDVACPWCYVGMKRMEKAMALLPEIKFNINWQPYQLDPGIPMAGTEIRPYFEKKFGSAERIEEIYEHMKSVGEEEGIDFKLHEMQRTMNSLPLHTLLQEAEIEGFKSKLKERFFKAYFEETIDLSQISNIQAIMQEYGWAAEKTLSIIKDKSKAEAVLNKIQEYQVRGVKAVPFFIFENTYGVSGAQAPDKLAEMILEINAEITQKKEQTNHSNS